MIAAAVLLSFLPAGAPDEFTEQLARLGAPRAAERTAAERWLEAHLVMERYPELAEAALAGDAEVRGRLVHVLSSDARHLPLALLLSGEKDSGLNALGREAVRAAVVHTDPRLAEPAVRDGLDYQLRRAASASPPRYLRLDPHLPLARMVEELELVGELPLGLTLDPRLATRTIRREVEIPAAAWNDLFLQVARAIGVGIEIHGLARRSGNELGSFLYLTAETGTARTGVDLISEWLLVLAVDRDESARARAACNLASSGFAPGLEWMDQLVRSRGDRAALEGLLLAAARGRVAPALLEPAVLEPLLAEAEKAAGPRSARILCALARAGCFDARGGELVPRLLAGFETATPRARWLRLLLLEEDGCAGAGVEPLARGLLADPGTAPVLRLRALFALANQGSGGSFEPVRIEGLPEIFRVGLDELEVERLGRVLRLFSQAPPFADPARIPADWSAPARLALVQAWLWRGEAGPLGAHLAAWMQSPPADARARGESLADELRPWRARGAEKLLGEALKRAEDLAPAQAASLVRVRLLLGLVPAQEVPGALSRARCELDGEHADLALLATLAAYPTTFADDARRTLLSRLTVALTENHRLEEYTALLNALESAAVGMYSAGLDEDGDGFSGKVLEQCRRSKADLGRRWPERRPWPPAPFAETLDVSRALARFEVPASL
jgi:hypothetical protein